MSTKPEVKVCGLIRLADAELAVELGAGFLGFNCYPKSPRFLGLSAFRALREQLPPAKRVYVQVRPEPDELREAADEGFDLFQLHFSVGEDPRLIEAWATLVSPARLWLAPRIAPGEIFPKHLLGNAETFMIDTYRKGAFGGTGETGDWDRFRQWAEGAPEKRWVLAGGLSPENIAEAVEASQCAVADVNSGIEERPGLKDPVRMRAFFAALAGCG